MHQLDFNKEIFCSRQLIRMRNHNVLKVLFYTVADLLLVITVCSEVNTITALLPKMLISDWNLVNPFML